MKAAVLVLPRRRGGCYPAAVNAPYISAARAAAALNASAAGQPLLSVVIPVRNEAANVVPLVGELMAALGGLAHEIVFVDDGSSDATPAELAGIARPGLRWLRHRRSCGQSAAVITGVRAARGVWIATIDGDGQNDPADIPVLFSRALAAEAASPAGQKLLIAGHRTRRRDSTIKRLSSRVANAVRGRLLGDRTPDTGCGLKLFRRDAFLAMPHFDHMHRFLPALFIRAGGVVESVPVGHRPRLRGRSNYGTLDRLAVGIVDLAGVFWLQRRWTRPDIERADDAIDASDGHAT